MEFTTVQLGLDVATSLAVTGSAAAFFINQAHKYKQTKRLQMDTSVRTVATEKLQEALHELSRRYVHDVVQPLQRVHNLLSTLGDSTPNPQLFENDKERPQKLFEQFDKMSSAIEYFNDEIHACRYQLFPLLDTLSNGQQEIKAFKEEFDELFDLYNQNLYLRNILPLSLRDMLKHPFENLNNEQKKEFIESIIFEHSLYLFSINSLQDNSEKQKKAPENIIEQHLRRVYEDPNLLRFAMFHYLYARFEKGRKACKKFLIMLAAINYTLLKAEDSKDEALSDTTKRYAKKEFFALDDELR